MTLAWPCQSRSKLTSLIWFYFFDKIFQNFISNFLINQPTALTHKQGTLNTGMAFQIYWLVHSKQVGHFEFISCLFTWNLNVVYSLLLGCLTKQIACFYKKTGKSLPKWSTFQVIHSSAGSWPHQQTLDWARKVCLGQTL